MPSKKELSSLYSGDDNNRDSAERQKMSPNRSKIQVDSRSELHATGHKRHINGPLERWSSINSLHRPTYLESSTEATKQTKSHDHLSPALEIMCEAVSEQTHASPGSTRTSESSFTDMAPVEAYNYRSRILAPNNIYILNRRDELPERQTELMQRLCGTARSSPEPTIDEVAQDAELDVLFNKAVESSVTRIFLAKFTSETENTKNKMLKLAERMPLLRHHVPQNTELPEELRLTYPVPDILYGYDYDAFSPGDLEFDQELLSEVTANADGVILPFFTIEVKSQFPKPGSLWAGENQAAGSSSTCVKVMEDLNEHLGQHGDDMAQMKLDNSVFSAVMNGTEVRLFVTWKSQQKKGAYLMKQLRTYILSAEDHYVQFRRTVRNILDWGIKERLKEIRSCLHTLRRRQSAGAKKRMRADSGTELQGVDVVVKRARSG